MSHTKGLRVCRVDWVPSQRPGPRLHPGPAGVDRGEIEKSLIGLDLREQAQGQRGDTEGLRGTRPL